jgi:hypothetical protein
VGSSDRTDERIDLTRKRLIPAASQLPGFEGGAWVVDRDSHRFLSVTYWATDRQLIESAEAVAKLRDNALRQVGGRIEWVRRFEVVARI